MIKKFAIKKSRHSELPKKQISCARNPDPQIPTVYTGAAVYTAATVYTAAAAAAAAAYTTAAVYTAAAVHTAAAVYTDINTLKKCQTLGSKVC